MTRVALPALCLLLSCGCDRGRAASGSDAPRPGAYHAPGAGTPSITGRPTLEEMRDQLHALYRLPPDRRLTGAFDDLAALVSGTQARPVDLRFEGDRWHVSRDGAAIGVLPKWPDFDDVLTVLVTWAEAQLAGAHRLQDEGAPVAEIAGLSPLEGGLARLAELEAAWRAGPSKRLLKPAAQALASVVFQWRDDLEIADGIPSHALALLALAIAAGAEEMSRTEALLAEALGYSRAARELAKGLPEDDPLRAYVLREDEKLREIAGRDGSSFEARYLWLRRLNQKDLRDDEERFRSEMLADQQLSLSVLGARNETSLHWVWEAVHAVLPWIVLQHLSGGAPPTSPAGAEAGSGSLAELGAVEMAVAEGLNVGPSELAARLEAALGALPAPGAASLFDAGFRRSFFEATAFSGFYGQFQFDAEVLSSQGAAERRVRAFEGAKDGLFSEFRRWQEVWIAAEWRSLAPDRLVDALGEFEVLGAVPQDRLLALIRDRLEFAAPSLFTAANAVVRRMDSRLRHRHLLADIAMDALFDLPLLEEVVSSIRAAAPGRSSFAETTFAAYSDDRALMRSLLGDQDVWPRDRAWLVRELYRRGAMNGTDVHERFRGIIAGRPEDWDIRKQYVRHLKDTKEYAVARETITSWLAAHGEEARGLVPLAARVALAEILRLERRFAEALDVLEPIARSQYGPMLRERALGLCGLGRSDEAEAEARATLRRYSSGELGVGLAARVYWCSGRFDDAGRLLAQPPVALRLVEWDSVVGTAFVRQFRELPDETALEAFDALWEGQVPPDGMEQIAYAVERDGRKRLAFEMLSRLNVGGQMKFRQDVHAYLLLAALEGEKPALQWLFARLGAGSMAPPFDMMVYGGGADELLWTAVPDPPDASRDADFTWLLRAAAATRSSVPADRRRALEAHFRGEGATYYHLIGRYLLGRAPLSDVLPLGDAPDRLTEVAYYAGLKAEAEKRFRDASDWYRIAVEQGQSREGEYGWALNVLRRWRTAARFLSAPARPSASLQADSR